MSWSIRRAVSRVPALFKIAVPVHANGNRTRVDDSKGGVTTSVYDAADRLSSRELGGSGITKLKVSWGYDERDQVTGEYRWKWAASAWSPASTSTYAYDTSGRLTGLRHRDGSGHRK